MRGKCAMCHEIKDLTHIFSRRTSAFAYQLEFCDDCGFNIKDIIEKEEVILNE